MQNSHLGGPIISVKYFKIDLLVFEFKHRKNRYFLFVIQNTRNKHHVDKPMTHVKPSSGDL